MAGLNGRRISLPRPLAGAALGSGLVALGAVSGLAVAGRKIRRRHDAALDALSAIPDGVRHRYLPTADGGTVHVAEIGEGRPIVLLHGVTLQWWVWAPLINLLKDNYRVIAWDMPGHGESELGSDGFTMDTLCRDLAMVFETLDLHDAILVGHSLGGCTVGAFIGRQPKVLAERVAGLMFVATAANLVEGLVTKGDLKSWFGAAGGILLLGLRKPNPANPWKDNDITAALTGMAFGPAATREMVDAVRIMVSEFPASTSVQAAKVLTTHDARAALATVSIPATIVAGEYDRILPPGHSAELLAAMPGAELIELAGVGHQIMQEAPQELLYALEELESRISAD